MFCGFGSGEGGAGVFEVDAGELAVEGLGEEVVEDLGGGGWGEAVGADVGDAVAVGVGVVGVGVVDEVGAEGCGGGEAGAFAEEDEGELGVLELADVVLDGDAGVFDEGEGGEGDLGLSRRGRRAVRRSGAFCWSAGAERPSARIRARWGFSFTPPPQPEGCTPCFFARTWAIGGVEFSAEVGALEVGGAVCCLGVEL